MDRLRRLHDLWSWLPAFRAVAETEHLPTAARQLGVSAPALSRSVHLIEQRLGTPLFHRERRRLVLNEAGRAMLDSLRDAMRLLDDGWDLAVAAELRGEVRLGVAGRAAEVVLAPTLEEVRRDHPEISFHLSHGASASLLPGLLDGTLDLVVSEHELADRRLRSELLARLPMHVYRGRAAPSGSRRREPHSDLSTRPFVIPADGVSDGWPNRLPRRIGAVSDSVALTVELCVNGPWLAVLPEAIERATGRALARVDGAPRIAPAKIYVAGRGPSARSLRTRPGRIEVVFDTLLRSVERRPSAA